MTVQNVHLAGLGLRGGTLLFNLSVANPSRFALTANELRYQLLVADTRLGGDTIWLDLASGAYLEQLSVGSGETASLQVPVEFTYQGLGGAASSVLRAGSFSYRASGSVDVRTPLGSREVPFQRGGTVAVLGPR